MVPPEPHDPSDLGQPATADRQVDDFSVSRESSPSPRKGRPWLTVLSVLIVLLGLGFGWRWWQSRNAAAPAGPGAAQAQAAPVQLQTVETSTVSESSEFVGTLTSRRSVDLRPEIDGRVTEILVQPGDTVEVGQPLVLLSPDQRAAEYASVLAAVNSARATRASSASELQALQAERIAAVAEVDLQNENFRRTSQLVQEGALAQDQLDQVERDRRSAIATLNATDQRIQASRADLAESEAALQQAQANAAASNAQLQDTVIEAPFAGTMGDIPAKVGDFVNAGDVVTSVTQDQALELEISVPLERGPDLRTGQRVELIDAQGTPLTVGRINFTAPQVNTAAQSILVKANFDNPDGRLRAGQFVRARVIWDESPGVLVPTSAISRLGGETFVFVAETPSAEEGQAQAEQAPQEQAPQRQAPGAAPQLIARQKQVELGDIEGNSYQVIEGLEPGEQIVVSGVLNLSDGVPIMPQPETQSAGGQEQG
ncbi:efflux RND transporter periplasmic adaptor subunit [Leptolyngbya sp. FACHB-671]|uniref:efflux RND transporter periplasmic adaptor subunit n=1 Tax=Leptolyngbya sp. FACHB-671 TaxID=2692812 RepID=UPI0016875D19|nr:efflux RND transporter periplasmic adaptor subunit [Leptolyngbya sp. FACHB-671]MBD2066924.1 efflux RND transporter periplasmic adaptor subunit [Leptolyngbya sp. FACHB-671]